MTDLRKLIKLDLSNVPIDQHKEAKNAVGNYLVNQVLRDIERGFSPVEGKGQFPKLTKDYADKEKGGRRVANLDLEGELKEAIQFKRTEDGIEYGNFIKSQAPKADGHNQHSAKAKAWAKKTGFPERQYIPEGKKKFRQAIEREMKSIVQSFEEVATSESEDNVFLNNETETGNIVTTEIAISDDVIEEEIRRQIS